MRTHKILKTLLLSLSLILTVALLFPGPAFAQGLTVEDTVKEGEVVDHNLILSGPTVRMDGTVEGDLLAIGDKVTINGKVDGNLVVAGNQVVLNGPVSGNVYIGAATLVVGPQASAGRDVSYIGGMFETNETSTIKRDLNMVSLDSKMAGSTGRHVNALVGPLRVGMVIYDFMKNQGWLPKTTGMDFQYAPSTSALGSSLAYQAIGPLVLVSSHSGQLDHQPQAAPSNTDQWKTWGIALLRNIAAFLIIGLLWVWLLPAQLTFASEQPRTRPWRSVLTGLLILLVGWLVILIALLLFLALAFFLFWASLPNLGFLVGSLGILAVGLASVIFWLSIVYFSKVIVAFWLGRLLFKRFMPKYQQSFVWALIVGVILFALIVSIPYLGWVASVMATMFGLGALWLVAFPRRAVEEQTATVPEVAGVGLH